MPGRRSAAQTRGMSFGASLFLVAIGAILHFAVTASFAGIDIQTVGTILMIVGVLGLAISLWLYFQARRATPGPPPPPSSTYY
jgi:hypothetical protein